jgi:hypothetical protein
VLNLAALLGTAILVQSTGPAGPRPSDQDLAKPCVPACRKGFVCEAGICVSACRPDCGPNMRCTDERTCVPEPAPPFQRPPQGPYNGPPSYPRTPEYGFAGPPPAVPPMRPRPKGYHLHDGLFLRGSTLAFAGLVKDGPALGGQLDIGYAPVPGLIPFGSISLAWGEFSVMSEHVSQTYVNPAVGCLFYPDPEGGVSVGVRFGYLSDHVNWGGATTDAGGLQVSGELGFGFWISSNLQISFHATGGYFHISGSGSGTVTDGSGYSHYEIEISTSGPYGGVLVALTFN